MAQRKQKTANEILDYAFDFAPLTNSVEGAESDYLADGETISTTFTVTAETGINLHDGSTEYDGVTKAAPARANTNTRIVFWLSGGTVGGRYTITCKATTSDGRIVERVMIIDVVKAKAR